MIPDFVSESLSSQSSDSQADKLSDCPDFESYRDEQVSSIMKETMRKLNVDLQDEDENKK